MCYPQTRRPYLHEQSDVMSRYNNKNDQAEERRTNPDTEPGWVIGDQPAQSGSGIRLEDDAFL
jgi:hypothetical protein